MLALAAGIFSASALHHFAPEASHMLSTFQPLLHARENTKCKMKEKHPKIDIIERYWISISLHKLTADTEAYLLHLVNLLPSFKVLL